MYVQVSTAGVHRGMKRSVDLLKPNLQVVVSYPMLRTELESSRRAANTLSHWAFSPYPIIAVLFSIYLIAFTFQVLIDHLYFFFIKNYHIYIYFMCMHICICTRVCIGWGRHQRTFVGVCSFYYHMDLRD